MQLRGELVLGQQRVRGTSSAIYAINPATGEQLEPAYNGGSAAAVEQACALAESASVACSETTLATRARFLETIAAKIEQLGDALIQRAMLETGLPRARLEGERARTCGQLRLFAQVISAGAWLDLRIDPARPERQPLPRADLRQRRIALGPVAVFGASNFPLAFSVAGGDTASALAAGCPVIVKAHSAHPGTSELVGLAIQSAAARCAMPEGVFSLLFGSGREVGQALVADARVQAVGFTGSRSGGTALMAIAQGRPQPIPVYAEMSSINPAFLLPQALRSRAEQLAQSFAASLTLGAGQFCTSPGLVIAQAGPELDRFMAALGTALGGAPAQTMLTPGIHSAFESGVASLAHHPRIRPLSQGQSATGPNQCQPIVFTVAAADFLADEVLQQEVFGSCSLLIQCEDEAQMRQITAALEGQLTATLQMDDEDLEQARALLPLLERKAGRILVNGWPTGVEVCHAMVHGGPFPATSDARTTSVGSAAIERFLRPVCYQDLPQALLPEPLKDQNLPCYPHLLDGKHLS